MAVNKADFDQKLVELTQEIRVRVLSGLTRARTVNKAYTIVEARMAYRMIA
jgi:hypothetical protein